MPIERRTRRDGYEEIYEPCLPFESKLTIDQARNLRDSVLNDYLLTVPGLRVKHGEHESTVRHAKLFANKFTADIDDMPSVFGSAMLRHFDTDSWRLVVMQTRTRRRSENIGQQRIVSRWNVEVMQDQVVEAVRKVQVYRAMGDLTAAAISQSWALSDEGDVPVRIFEEDKTDEALYDVERMAMERHMVPQDCDRAVEFLGRISSRLVAVG